MFDSYVDRRSRRRPRWLGALIAFSFITHFVVISFFVISAMWQIDKLAMAKTQTVYITRAALANPGGAPPPPMKKPVTSEKKTVKKRIAPKDLVQPHPRLVVEENVEVDDGGSDWGVPDGKPGSSGSNPFGTGLGDGFGDGPGDLSSKVVVEDLCVSCPDCCAPPKEPVIVPVHVIEGSRRAGNSKIHPPDSVKLAMARDDVDQVVATIRMCLDASGKVTSLRQIKSSGYPIYDDKIEAEMRSWRYEPYLANGKAIPVCTAVTFIYRMSK